MRASAYTRALVVLEREPETRLDLNSSLDETGRRRLRGPHLGVPDSCDRHCEQRRVTDPLSPLQRGPCVDQSLPNVRLEQAHEAPVRENPRRAHLVAARLGKRLVAELDDPRGVRSPRQRELEEDVRPLDTGRSLLQELVEGRNCTLPVTGEAVVCGRVQASPPCQRGVVRGEVGREPRELARRGGRPTCCRLLGGRLQLGGDSSVGAVCGERQMAGALLGVRHNVSQSSVHGLALPERRALVADRSEERMREADVRVVELDHRLLRRRLERLQDTVALSVGRRHQLDRRSRESGDEQQDVERLAGEACQPASEQLAQALGHAQRLARRRSRVRSDQLAAELQREERVARGRLLHAGELGPRQLEPQPLLEQVVHGGERERADRQPLEPLVRERALELDRARDLRSQPQSGQEPDRLRLVDAGTRSGAHPPTPGRATGRRRGRRGPAPARTGHARRPAPPARSRADRAPSRRAPRAAAPPRAPAAAEARAKARPRRARRRAAPRDR